MAIRISPEESTTLFQHERPMRYRQRSVTYFGQPFHFERIETGEQQGPYVTWAVIRRGEFIGTMNCAEEITTSEFDARCGEWLTDLLRK